MQRRRPAHQVIDGIPRCVGADPDSLRKALKFRAEAGDVVQSTYPKSGTNWVQYITQLILNCGAAVLNFEEYSRNYRLLEYVNFERWKSPLSLRIFTTHLPLSRDAITKEGKYVYVARNPWDVCVSLFHMVTNLSSHKFQDGTFEEFVDAFLAGDFGYGDYFEHVASGYALKNEPNVFLLPTSSSRVILAELCFGWHIFSGSVTGKPWKMTNTCSRSCWRGPSRTT